MRRRSTAFLGGPNPTLQKKSSSKSSLTPYALNLLGPNASESANSEDADKNSSKVSSNPNSIDNKSGGEEVKPILILSAGAHGEQGYRRTMEDEHVMELCLNTTGLGGQSCKFFGVFDGHGGTQCSIYIKDNIVDVLTAELDKIDFVTDVEDQDEKVLQLTNTFLRSIKFF